MKFKQILNNLLLAIIVTAIVVPLLGLFVASAVADEERISKYRMNCFQVHKYNGGFGGDDAMSLWRCANNAGEVCYAPNDSRGGLSCFPEPKN